MNGNFREGFEKVAILGSAAFAPYAKRTFTPLKVGKKVADKAKEIPGVISGVGSKISDLLKKHSPADVIKKVGG